MPPTQPASPKTSKKYRFTTPLLIMFLPGVALVASIIIYAIIHFFIPDAAPQAGELFAKPNPLVQLANVSLFLVGALSVVAGLPCFIVGLILLIQRNSK